MYDFVIYKTTNYLVSVWFKKEQLMLLQGKMCSRSSN